MRCKQGDLAFLLRSLLGTNVGKIVEVVEYIGYFNSEETFIHNGMNCRVPITDHYWWIYCASGLDTPMGPTSKAYGPDSWLKPIPPELLDDDEQTGDEVYLTETIPETAT